MNDHQLSTSNQHRSNTLIGLLVAKHVFSQQSLFACVEHSAFQSVHVFSALAGYPPFHTVF